MLVGPNGAGKTSTLVVSIIARLRAGHRVHIVDTKQELGQIFEKHATIHQEAEVATLIKRYTDVANDRMKFFSDEGRRIGHPIRDISEYKKITGNDMETVTIFVDEMMVIAKNIDTDILVRLYAMGRSSGIFLYAVAQYLNDKILPRICTANILIRAAMGAPDNVALRTLFPAGIPKDVRERLKDHLGPPGKALVYNGNTNKFNLSLMPRIDDSVLVEFMQ